MAPSSKTKKLTILIAVSSLFLVSVSAASLEPVDNSDVWLGDSNNVEEFSIEMGEDESVSDFEVVLKDDDGNLKETVVEDEETIHTEDFRQLNLGYNDYVLHLSTSSGNDNLEDTAQVSIRKLDLQMEEPGGRGFVGEKLGAVEGTQPVQFDIELRNAEPEEFAKAELESSFEVRGSSASIKESSDVDVIKGDTIEVTAEPYVGQLFSGDLTMELKYNGVSFREEFSPELYNLRAVPNGKRPPIEMEYSRIDEFEYYLDIYREGKDVSNTDVRLYDENFTLDITGLGEASYDGEEGNILNVNAIDNENADYSVTLDRVPQLDPGQYRFTVKMLTEKHDEEGILVDEIRVNNALRLSGRVQDSESSSVQAKFTLSGDSTEIPIATDESGTYYKEIGSGNEMKGYNVNLKFFDISTFSGNPDADITLNNVDFRGGESENLAGDQESIKFQYWRNPPVEEDAIDPVNMMAVKFAYPMDSAGHTAKMSYNPANVNPDDLKVYSCSYWNFEGRSCLGGWTGTDDLTIDHQGSNVIFGIDDPYLAENTDNGDKNILMNAYLVGTSADLILTNSLDVSGTTGGRIETSGDVDVSGRISSENDNFVEGAEVDITFLEGSAEVHSLDTVETDSEGRFTASGKAPEDPGNYTVKVEASADNYNNLDTELENRFEVFIPEGVALDAESPLDVTLGQDEATTVTVENTGQTEMQDVELTFSGMSSDFYSTSGSDFSSIESGDSRTTEITFSLPESYGIDSYPSLEISVSAQNSEDKEFTDEETIQTQLSRPSGTDSSEEERSSEDPEETEGSSSFSTDEVAEMTGEFIESQSSLNIALGMILVFLMVIAGAVSKKSDQKDRRTRPQVQKPLSSGSGNSEQKPNISSNHESKDDDSDDQDEEVQESSGDQEDEFDSQIDEIAGVFEQDSEVEEETENEEAPKETIAEELEEEEQSHFACEVCGEKFDSKSGRKLHESVMHDE